MTRRTFLVVLCAVLMLVCALSTRGALFWLIFWTLCAMLAVGLSAALWASRTLTLSCSLDNDRVPRGGQVTLQIRLTHRSLLPVAALRVSISVAAEAGFYQLFAAIRPFVQNELKQMLYCPHVGPYPAGVSAVRVRDVFGLFSITRRFSDTDETLVVLPLVHLTDPPAFSPGESDLESAVARAFEDATLPTDVRAYQPGDELKKIHWKLSMRKREVLVRVFEQPMRPDALLLVDCAPPEAADIAGAANLRDAICEAAASVASAALNAGAPVRMPLVTETPTDVNAAAAADIGVVCDALGRCAFNAAEQFERVLLLETRRLRRTGSTTIVTSRMNPVIADMILRIRRMGPKVCVLLAADPETEEISQIVHRLMRNDVEVKPVAAELL